MDDVDNSHLSLYSAHINNPNDWSQGASFTGDNNSQLIAVAAYTGICGGQFGGACVPQEGTSERLDSLGERFMYRFAYWEDQPLANVLATPPKPVPSQHWLVNHSVEANGGNGAVRWYELTAPIKNVPVTVIGLPGVGSVYSESLSTSGHASGTSGSPITFIAQGRVVVSAPGDVRALLQNRSYWTWKYFIFEGPSIASTQLAYVQSAATVVFDYCTFRNTPLMTSGGRAVLAYASTVYFYNDVITENQLSGLELQNSSTVVMRNSVVAEKRSEPTLLRRGCSVWQHL